MAFFMGRKKIPKFIWEQERTQIFKMTLNRKNTAGGLSVPDFKLYYRAMVIRAVGYQHKNRHVDQDH